MLVANDNPVTTAVLMQGLRHCSPEDENDSIFAVGQVRPSDPNLCNSSGADILAAILVRIRFRPPRPV